MKPLRLKHWQLFLLTFAIPFVVYFIGFLFTMARIVTMQMTENLGEPTVGDFLPLIFAGIIALAGAVIHYIWIYRIATKLQAYMQPDTRKMQLKRFRIFFFSPFVYLLVLAIILPSAIGQAKPNEPLPAAMIAAFIFIIPGHLYTLFCAIYTLYFTAKTIKSVELKREAHFSDYVGEFFLLWFYFVGVWILQPRINKIVMNGEAGMLSEERLDE